MYDGLSKFCFEEAGRRPSVNLKDGRLIMRFVALVMVKRSLVLVGQNSKERTARPKPICSCLIVVWSSAEQRATSDWRPEMAGERRDVSL